MPFISHHYPHDHSCRWVEPFIGGGAVFLNMFAQNALLADSNPDLINLYRTIQRQKTNFINQVQNLIDRNLNPQKTKKAPQNGYFFNTPCAPYE
ncbi:DNA adenine methylase, partial [Escherichia coli]